MKNIFKDKKKRLVAIISLAVIVIAVVCIVIFTGNNKLLSGNKASKLVTAVANEKYYIKMVQVDSDMKETGDKVEFTKSGDDYVLATDNYSIIVKGEKCYLVSNKDKKVVEGSKSELGAKVTEPKLLSETTSVDKPEITTQKLGNTEYYSEKYNDITIYFDSDDNIAYINDGTNTVKVLDFDNASKGSMFKIPSGYETVTEDELNSSTK